MSGICGWINKNANRENAFDINKMAVKLPEGGAIENSIIEGNVALSAVSKNAGNIGIYSSNIFIAVDGKISWKEKVYQEYQEKNGMVNAIGFAYEKEGEKFLSHVYGVFAIAVYSVENDTLIVAIDRMGIKSLCINLENLSKNQIIFASNLASIIQHPDVEVKLDPQSIFNYVHFHFIPSPKTIFKNIIKLEPAQYIKVQNNDIYVNRYWKPNFLEDKNNSINYLSDRLSSLLNKVISKYSQNKTTGTFLSGGLDSSTVTGVLAKSSKNPVNTFSIGFSQSGYDEIPYARIAANHFKTVSHEYYVTPEDIVSALPKVAEAYDEPFGNSSAIPALFCAELAKKYGIKSLLAGDGGDELFAGNERYIKQKLLEKYQIFPRIVRRYLLEPLFLRLRFTKYLPVIKKIRSYIEQAQKPIIERMGEDTYNYLQGISPDTIFTKDMMDKIDINEPMILLTKCYTELESASFMNRMLFLDWKFTLADNDLRKVSRMCEISGVNVIFPMLDDNLVEFSTQIPSTIKIKGLKLRYFFKYAMREFLPGQIINKPKHGFGLPFGEWLKSSEELQNYIYGNLFSLKKRNIIRAEFIDEIIDVHKKGHAAYYGVMIWAFAMLEQWLKSHAPQESIK